MRLLFLCRIFNKLADRGLGERLNHCWNAISTLPVRFRKCFVLLCRAQCVIFEEPFNLLCIQTKLTFPRAHTSDPEFLRYYDLATHYRDLIESPIFSSVLLDMCRSAPLSRSEINAAVLASWGKEISICESPDPPHRFRYDCWLDPRYFNRPVLQGTTPNPQMARVIHHALLRWRSRLQHKILYPRMSRKMISHATRREYERIFGVNWIVDERDGGVEMTQETLERVYHQHGITLDGPCEIRQKWYQSGITPRTYFASGGTAYHMSKYIQEMASDLTAELDTTHPITRLNPARITLKDDTQYLRIYDLSGFTSNHWECKRFLDQLADWCTGYTTTIVDAVEGPVEKDIGVMISEYNQSMNYRADYSLERVCHDFDEVVEYHNRAGFLGVYGNINFSTFVHGASLLMGVSATDEANVAGDDAHYAETPGEEDNADRIIDANGYLEPEKVFRSDQMGAVCLKRGLTQMDQRVIPKLMAIFPSFSNLGQLFGFHPPQFPNKRQSGVQKLSLVGNELFRFIRGLYLSQITTDLPEAIDLLRAIYESASLPVQGSLPPYGDVLIPALPASPSDILDQSPLNVLLHYHFDDGVSLPRYLQLGELDESEDPPLFPSCTWIGTSTPKLKYLEVLEYVVKDELEEILYGVAAYDRIVDVYAGRCSEVYEWRCVAPIPSIFDTLPSR
jgi:hypothetical protein